MKVTKRSHRVRDRKEHLVEAIKKVKKLRNPRLQTVKVGFTVYDKHGSKYTVSKVEYPRSRKSFMVHEPSGVILRGEKSKTYKVSIKDLNSKYKTFHSREMLGSIDSEAHRSPIPVAFYTANPEVVEKPSYLNNIFPDERPTRMSGIIAAIQEQIKKDEREKNRKESDISLIYNDIQNRFNGFITRSGWFSDKLSTAIIFIDWLGEECRFKEYKATTFEKKQDYNVVIVYTSNKAKSFFINLLKTPILKYSTTGGK